MRKKEEKIAVEERGREKEKGNKEKEKRKNQGGRKKEIGVKVLFKKRKGRRWERMNERMDEMRVKK